MAKFHVKIAPVGSLELDVSANNEDEACELAYLQWRDLEPDIMAEEFFDPPECEVEEWEQIINGMRYSTRMATLIQERHRKYGGNKSSRLYRTSNGRFFLYKLFYDRASHISPVSDEYAMRWYTSPHTGVDVSTYVLFDEAFGERKIEDA
jgi:hypothetical protein